MAAGARVGTNRSHRAEENTDGKTARHGGAGRKQNPPGAVIFVILIGIVVVLSHVFYLMGASATHQSVNPDTDQVEEVTAAAKSVLTGDGLRFMYENVVMDFKAAA